MTCGTAPKARHTSCRAFFFGLLFAAAGCSPEEPRAENFADDTGARRPVIELVGRLANREIDEASGLARSRRSGDVFWIINDSGKPRLHPIDPTGRALGRVKLEKAGNSDWEDLASFEFEGKPYLLVADIGDNDSKRKDVRLYFVEEPLPDDKKADVAWRYDFEYPGGPRDAEAVAVDIGEERVFVLSKREIPPFLYELPLKPSGKKRQTASRLGPILTLPKPRRQDVEFAPMTDNYWWQPTAMDIAGNGQAAVILTYSGVFYYRRSQGEDWYDAMKRTPVVLSVADYREAESVAFNADDTAVYVTLEGRGAPLIRISLEDLSQQ